MQIAFTDCVEIVGDVCPKFIGKKKYISTGTVNVNEIDSSSVEIIEYENKPSRANLCVNQGDILFAKMQATKKVLIIDNELAEYIYSTGFFAVKPKPEYISEDCLFYLLNSNYFLNEKDKYCSGATQKAITLQGLSKIQINLPSIAEQDSLVKKLDTLSSIINCKKKQLVLLDDLIKSRFIELFGDVVQNDRGWEEFIFSDIATSRLGKMLDAKQQSGKCAYPYLANFNVQWFRFEIRNLNKMDFNDAERHEFELREGDLLVCEGGEIGRCAVWHNEIQPCYFQKALHRVRCKQDMILPDYMAWWFKYNCEHKGFASIEGAKATIAHLPGVKLKALKVAVPPIELQNQFVAFIKQTDKSKFSIQHSLLLIIQIM